MALVGQLAASGDNVDSDFGQALQLGVVKSGAGRFWRHESILVLTAVFEMYIRSLIAAKPFLFA